MDNFRNKNVLFMETEVYLVVKIFESNIYFCFVSLYKFIKRRYIWVVICLVLKRIEVRIYFGVSRR